MDFIRIIHIYRCVYIYICIYQRPCHRTSGPPLDYLPRLVSPRVGLRSGGRCAPSGRPCDAWGFPSLDSPVFRRARELLPLSLSSPSMYFVADRPLSSSSPPPFRLVLRGTLPSLATKTDDPSRSRSPLDHLTVFHASACLPRASRESLFSLSFFFPFSLAARGRRASSRRLLHCVVVVRPKNLTRADAFAPPAPLRVTGICKSIYL